MVPLPGIALVRWRWKHLGSVNWMQRRMIRQAWAGPALASGDAEGQTFGNIGLSEWSKGRGNVILRALAIATVLSMSRQHDALASDTMPRKTPQSTAARSRAVAARPATDRKDSTPPGRKTKSGDGRGSVERTKTQAPPRPASGNVRVGCDLSTGANSIRLTVRRHINEIKNCYDLELQKDHGLTGRVAVQFSVMPDGSVRTATVANSTLGNETVESCVVAAVRWWQFPAVPDRGEAIVTYPFALAPSETPSKLFGRDDR